MSKKQRHEKQQSAIEKLKLDSARKLKNLYYIDPEDVEFKETSRKTLKKLELIVEAAMPCKVKNHQNANQLMHAS